VEELQFEHTSEKWKLSINSSKVSLKALLIHNVNKFPPIPLVHTVHITETYEELQILPQKKKNAMKSPLEYLC
jgi:hypothetical protein